MTVLDSTLNIDNGFIVINNDKIAFSDIQGNPSVNIMEEDLDDFLSSFDVSGKDVGVYPFDDSSSAIVIGQINHSRQEGDLLAQMMEKVGKTPDDTIISSLLGISYGDYHFANDFGDNGSPDTKPGTDAPTSAGLSKTALAVIVGVLIISSSAVGLIIATDVFDDVFPIDDSKQDMPLNPQSPSSTAPIFSNTRDIENIKQKPIDEVLSFIDESNCPTENVSLNVDGSVPSENTLGLINLGNSFYDQRSYNQALLYYQAALEKNPKEVHALNGIGTIMELKEKYHESINCFRDVLTIQPNNINALNGIGNALFGLDRYEQALEVYEKSLLVSQENVNALNGIGNVRMELKQYGQAQKFYEQALVISPVNNNANVGMGRALTEMENFHDAMPYFDKVLDKNPHHLNAVLGKSIVFIKLEEYDKARYLLEQVVDIYPENKEIPFLLDKINFIR